MDITYYKQIRIVVCLIIVSMDCPNAVIFRNGRIEVGCVYIKEKCGLTHINGRRHLHGRRQQGNQDIDPGSGFQFIFFDSIAHFVGRHVEKTCGFQNIALGPFESALYHGFDDFIIIHSLRRKNYGRGG